MCFKTKDLPSLVYAKVVCGSCSKENRIAVPALQIAGTLHLANGVERVPSLSRLRCLTYLDWKGDSFPSLTYLASAKVFSSESFKKIRFPALPGSVPIEPTEEESEPTFSIYSHAIVAVVSAAEIAVIIWAIVTRGPLYIIFFVLVLMSIGMLYVFMYEIENSECVRRLKRTRAVANQAMPSTVL